jgi:hypothetical protein
VWALRSTEGSNPSLSVAPPAVSPTATASFIIGRMSASPTGDGIPSASAEHEVLGQLVVAEYSSVRAEWLEARSAQQHSMQWTFAAIAVILAGVFSKDLRSADLFAYVLATGVVALASALSELVWFGEVLRMERAALFLRGRERCVQAGAESAHRGQVYDPAPLAFETFRGQTGTVKGWEEVFGRTEAPVWIPKSSASVIGALALYGLMFLIGVTLLGDAAANAGADLSAFKQVVAWVIFGAAWAVYLVVTFYVAQTSLRVFRISERAADLSRIHVREPDDQVAGDVDGGLSR